jgi:hypothetical protein
MGFDAYASWLGIPADRCPPTYYDLLGLRFGESDPATIDRAALRRIERVRREQLGPHAELSQEVLAELARARLVLMDPDRRAEYDAARAAAPPPPRPAARPAPEVRAEAPADGAGVGVLGMLGIDASGASEPPAAPTREAARSRRPGLRRWALRGAMIAAHGTVLLVFLLYAGVLPIGRPDGPGPAGPPNPARPAAHVAKGGKPAPRATRVDPDARSLAAIDPTPPAGREPVRETGEEAGDPKEDDGGGFGEDDPKATESREDDMESPPDTPADDSPGAVLAGKGLTRSGRIYILRDEEREFLGGLARLQESCLAYQAGPLARLQGLQAREARLAQLRAFVSRAQTVIDETYNFENNLPPPRMRTNIHQESLAAAQAQRQEATLARQQARREMDEILNVPAPPNAIAVASRECSDALHAVQGEAEGLRQQADALRAHYGELASDQAVRAALEELSGEKPTLTVGPTEGLRKNLKEFQALRAQLRNP